MRKKIVPWLLFLSLLSLSTALRVFRLEMSFWMDELITISQFVPKPWLKIITEVPYPNNHILYTLLAKLSISFFGEKEWSARLPAVIFGSLTPPIFYLILRRRFSELISFGASLFLAFNFWSVWFSQDARGYSAFILLSFLSSWLFLENLKTSNTKTQSTYVLLSIISVWFYLYAMFLLGAQALYALNHWRRKKIKTRNLLPIFLSALLGISLYLPSLPSLWHYALSADKMSQLHPVNLLFFKELFLMLTGTRKIAVMIFFLLLALPGFFFLMEKERGLLIVNLIASLGIIIFSAFAKVFIYPRFLAFLMPLFALSIGVSLKIPDWIFRARNKYLSQICSWLLLGLILLLLSPGLWNYYTFGKQDFKGVAQYLKRHYPSEKIICYGIICPALNYYYSAELETRSEKEKLTREMIQGKVIISRRVDWASAHLDLIRQFCYTEKIWKSSGYRENILILFNCQ